MFEPQYQKEDKVRKKLRSHGLAFDEMSDDELARYNIRDIFDMDSKMSGSGLYSLGSLLSGNSETSYIMDLLKAQIRQQWIVIRQNEQIIRLLSDRSGRRSDYDVDMSREQDELPMELVRKVPAEITVASADHIGEPVIVSGNNVMVGDIIVGRLAPAMRGVLVESMGGFGKAILAEVGEKFATIEVYVPE